MADRTIKPLTDDQAATYRRTGTVCTGNCNQGRQPCTDDCDDAEFGPLSCRILYYSTAIVAIACVVVIVI